MNSVVPDNYRVKIVVPDNYRVKREERRGVVPDNYREKIVVPDNYRVNSEYPPRRKLEIEIRSDR